MPLVRDAGGGIVVREATVADAAAISAIGTVAFPAVHDQIAGELFSAAVVEQTYSISALTDCISGCSRADDAVFLVAERGGEVVGYLHYDSFGPEPELHRIYVDVPQKRDGVGSALMRNFHTRLDPGSTYVLLVAEANVEAVAFYTRHGLVVERRVDGNQHYTDAMGIATDEAPPETPGLLMRFTKKRR
jgi:ribosomal protein S18 acetylase RimI-like enzyme